MDTINYQRSGNKLLIKFKDLVGTNPYVCPYCKSKHEIGEEGFYLDKNYNKRKLYLKDDEVGFCVRCNNTFINDIDKTQFRNFKFNIKTRKYNDFEVYKISDDSYPWNLKELTKEKLNESKSRGEYIIPNDFGIKLTKKDGREGIYIPFRWFNEDIYYQIRFFDQITPKYYMPPIQSKPVYIPKIISEDKFIFVEGVFDALACLKLYPDYTPIAVLGSYLTTYQIELLGSRFLFKKGKIFFDETYISKKIKEAFESSNLSILDPELEIVESDGEDPEEKLLKLLGL